jgi:Spy/CpxP family protein refolding chaperone
MGMRKLTLMVMILIAFVVVNIKVSEAQRTVPSRNKESSEAEGGGIFWLPPSIGLTEAQAKKLEDLQQAFMAEAVPLRREVMFLRFELRHLILDQNVPSKTLFERQRKISELQGKLESLSLSYQIKARSILTKEQLEQLPEDCTLGIGTGFGMGTGREPRKGLLK